jgi:hypothetical protein
VSQSGVEAVEDELGHVTGRLPAVLDRHAWHHVRHLDENRTQTRVRDENRSMGHRKW